MHTTCRLTAERLVSRGSYTLADLVTISGLPLHAERAFLVTLAQRVMDRYESVPSTSLTVLNRVGVTISPATRTRRWYRRLFDATGRRTGEFITFASETLVQWWEEAMEGAHCAHLGPPHYADPAWDVLCIVRDNAGDLRTRLVQVKATRHQLSHNCAIAARKFRRLAAGDYDAELMARLSLLKDLGRLPEDGMPNELLYRSLYRVTALHSQRPTPSILASYKKHVPGGIERRSARLLNIDWAHFWDTLAAEIYAHLT